MTVLSHCGWLDGSGPGVTQEPWAACYSHPGRFEKTLRLYPDTVFILAPMGGIAGMLEPVMLTTRTANTFSDCSPGHRSPCHCRGNTAGLPVRREIQILSYRLSVRSVAS